MDYLNGEFRDYVEVDSAVQNHRVSHQPIEFAFYVLSGIQQLFTETLITSLAITAMLIFNASLFLTLGAFLLPAVLLAAVFTRSRLKSVRSFVKKNSEMAMQYLQEALNGFIEIAVYGRKSFFIERYARNQKSLNEHLSNLQIVQWVPSRLVELFGVSGLFILIVINHHYGTGIDAISIGAFIAAMYKIIPGISRMTNVSALVKTYSYTIDELSKSGGPSLEQNVQTDPINVIEFNNVSFRHGDKVILSQFHLRLTKGDFAGIVGVSGKGKTTILNLLLGFLSPSEGEILFNNTPNDESLRKSWLGRISYVKQLTFLIHDTIKQNITLDNGEVDIDRLQYSIRLAGLEAFVESSTEGLEKVITDNGRNISGGQRQRIAIARALYKESDVIILDEPFNELDMDAEQELLENFSQLAKQGMIILLVSHNSNSISYCNKVISIHE